MGSEMCIRDRPRAQSVAVLVENGLRLRLCQMADDLGGGWLSYLGVQFCGGGIFVHTRDEDARFNAR